MRIFPLVRFSALGLLGAVAAFAHDPYEITTEVWLRPATLEFDATMARSTSMAVLTGDRDSVPFDPAKFEALRSRFETAAPKFFLVTVNGVELPPPQVKVGLTVESDLEVHLVYARPPAGTLHIEAPHVTKLGYGYGNVTTVHGDKGALLDQRMLSSSEPALEVTIAAAPPPPPAAAPVTKASEAKAPSAAATPVTRFRPAVALIAVVIVGAVVWVLSRRKGGGSASEL